MLVLNRCLPSTENNQDDSLGFLAGNMRKSRPEFVETHLQVLLFLRCKGVPVLSQ